MLRMGPLPVRRTGRNLIGLVFLLGFLDLGFADPPHALFARFLDQPVPVDLVAAGALDAGLADDLVEAAGETSRSGRRAAVGAGAAEIGELERAVGPALPG